MKLHAVRKHVQPTDRKCVKNDKDRRKKDGLRRWTLQYSLKFFYSRGRGRKKINFFVVCHRLAILSKNSHHVTLCAGDVTLECLLQRKGLAHGAYRGDP